ncbi:hypothetical protein M8C21_031433, partial [Ambrosia artemisiifolia]
IHISWVTPTLSVLFLSEETDPPIRRSGIRNIRSKISIFFVTQGFLLCLKRKQRLVKAGNLSTNPLYHWFQTKATHSRLASLWPHL